MSLPLPSVLAGGDGPAARSLLHHEFHTAGARFIRLAGWEVAVAVAGEERTLEQGAGVVDLSASRKASLQGKDVGGGAPDVGRLAAPSPGSVTPPPAASGPLATVWPELDARPARDQVVRLRPPWARWESSPDKGCLHLSDVTAELAHLALVGPGAADALKGLAKLDVRPQRFPPEACAATALAAVPGLVLRPTEREIHLLFSGTFAAFLWEALEALGVRPVGLEAYARWRAG